MPGGRGSHRAGATTPRVEEIRTGRSSRWEGRGSHAELGPLLRDGRGSRQSWGCYAGGEGLPSGCGRCAGKRGDLGRQEIVLSRGRVERGWAPIRKGLPPGGEQLQAGRRALGGAANAKGEAPWDPTVERHVGDAHFCAKCGGCNSWMRA